MLVAILWFQFHKGTIKTQLRLRILHFLFEFQFHKGTIKTSSQLTIWRQVKHFNSIKVRLKLSQTEQRAVVRFTISIP